MSQDTAMIEILGKILSRLVNVALFIVITILAIVYLRENTNLNLALIALISVVVGVLGTYLVRLLFKLIRMIGDLFT